MLRAPNEVQGAVENCEEPPKRLTTHIHNILKCFNTYTRYAVAGHKLLRDRADSIQHRTPQHKDKPQHKDNAEYPPHPRINHRAFLRTDPNVPSRRYSKQSTALSGEQERGVPVGWQPISKAQEGRQGYQLISPLKEYRSIEKSRAYSYPVHFIYSPPD